MSDILVREIVEGIGETGVRCGLIGEMGCSSPLTDNEKKSLKAAALAQQRTGEYEDKTITLYYLSMYLSLPLSISFPPSLAGAPLIIHPGRDEGSPAEIVDVLESSGADLSHTVMSHLDRTIFSDQKLLDFAKRSSCYLEFDLFGVECSHYQVQYQSEA